MTVALLIGLAGGAATTFAVASERPETANLPAAGAAVRSWCASMNLGAFEYACSWQTSSYQCDVKTHDFGLISLVCTHGGACRLGQV